MNVKDKKNADSKNVSSGVDQQLLEYLRQIVKEQTTEQQQAAQQLLNDWINSIREAGEEHRKAMQAEAVKQFKLDSELQLEQYKESLKEQGDLFLQQRTAMLTALKENGMSLLTDSVKEFSSLLGDETDKALKELGVLFTAQKKQFIDDFKQYQSSLREHEQGFNEVSLAVLDSFKATVKQSLENMEKFHQESVKLQETVFKQRRQELDELQHALEQRDAGYDQRSAELKKKLQEIEVKRYQLEADIDSFKMESEAFEQSKESRVKLQELTADRNLRLRLEQLENQLQEALAENQVLKEDKNNIQERLNSYYKLQHQFGERDPNVILQELQRLQKDNQSLQQRLIMVGNKATQEDNSRLLEENKQLKQALGNYQQYWEKNKKAWTEYQIHETEFQSAKLQIESDKKQIDLLTINNEMLMQELERFRTPEKLRATRDKCIQAIEQIPADYAAPDSFLPDKTDELEWLDNIQAKFKESEFYFSNRMLHAFHTSLKIAEWSPLTVLAGVSGTGKSELPHLYSMFGGINFKLQPVQPNWDCQEAMLGYFNSIDNVFDAQEVLKFLVQAQERDNFLHKDTLNIVLLDEMNLAHIELYFAEFLSKLESRRGKARTDVPVIDIKLGAGLDSYPLALGRNVLWLGTMNQDETTKSLSDKVIDRSNILFFPRPESFVSRRSLEGFVKQSMEHKRDYLNIRTWKNHWVQFDIKFEPDEIKPFKNMLENINSKLNVVGRALGHRVWQSIEYYMANYPAVLKYQQEGDKDKMMEAMRIAFEDQLVMKVMPKLRGIETRGRAYDVCLKEIGNVIDGYSIKQDFDEACEGAYGQFVWNNSRYLESDDVGV